MASLGNAAPPRGRSTIYTRYSLVVNDGQIGDSGFARLVARGLDGRLGYEAKLLHRLQFIFHIS